jgi:hypothetical protein
MASLSLAANLRRCAGQADGAKPCTQAFAGKAFARMFEALDHDLAVEPTCQRAATIHMGFVSTGGLERALELANYNRLV